MATARVSLVQPQDLVLTIFGAYVREPDETVWSGGLVEVLGQFGFSTDASRAALARLVLRGLLTRHKTGRRVSYSLSPRAEQIMSEGDDRIFTFGRAEPSSDRWTVVWHAIPESRRVERSRLASGLRFLGFGSVQDATWIAAHDSEPEVVRLLTSLDVASYASVLVGRLSPGLVPTALVAQAWDLDGMRDSYHRFLEEFAPYRSPTAVAALDDEQAFVIRTLLVHRFRSFPFIDPELPRDVSDDHGLRASVVETFDEAYANLAEPALRRFHHVTQPTAATPR
jgi:phenylacetic acid degradation operon negative regulatory protein